MKLQMRPIRHVSSQQTHEWLTYMYTRQLLVKRLFFDGIAAFESLMVLLVTFHPWVCKQQQLNLWCTRLVLGGNTPFSYCGGDISGITQICPVSVEEVM